MEDWLKDLLFAEPETPQQAYERKAAMARQKDMERRDAPRNEAERLMRMGQDFVGEPAPPWYDNPEVWESLSDAERAEIKAVEMADPYERRSPMQRTVEQGVRGLGKMFRSGPKSNGYSSIMGNVNTVIDQERNARSELRLKLLGQLLMDLEPAPQSGYAGPGSAAPPGFGSKTMPEYPEFQGETQTDPEIQRQMEQRRFDQMMQLRGRPLNTIPPEQQ
jgi:hypothetical protein